MERGDQGLQVSAQALCIDRRGQHSASKRLWHGTCLGFEHPPSGCQINDHAALIAGIAPAFHEPGGFEPLQERGESAAVEHHSRPDPTHRERGGFPQHQHNQILRIGQAERLKQRTVDPDDGIGSGIERKTQLLIQAQGLFNFREYFGAGHCLIIAYN
jgi:hypothetical protein